MNDATWISDLVACGLIQASFVPEEEIQHLRSLLRARKLAIAWMPGFSSYQMIATSEATDLLARKTATSR